MYIANNTKFNISPNLYDVKKVKNINAFTVYSHDNPEELIPFFKSRGIKIIFNSAGYNKIHKGIKFITIPYISRNSGDPKKKNILYSFVGHPNCSVRLEIFKMKHPKNTILIARDRHFGGSLNRNQAMKEYIDIITRSRFSLCPRGKAPGTYRFWESLKAGAIPVLISDDYKLPTGFNWNNCIIRVEENKIKRIPQILANISEKKENEMRKNCLRAYSLYSGENFDRVIRNFFQHYEKNN